MLFGCPMTNFESSGFSLLAGWVESPTSQNLLIPPPPGKIPPTKFLSNPQPKVHSPSLSNNFLNSQNHSSSDSHHPIKKSPLAKFIISLHWGKNIFPLPLKAIWKTLPTKFSVPQPNFHLQPKKNFHVA